MLPGIELDTVYLAGGGSVAASDVVGHVSDEQFLHLVGNGARCGSDFVAGNFAYADNVAIGGGNKYFVGRIELFRSKVLLDNVDPGFRRDFGENSASNTFQAARAEWWRIDLAVFHSENVRCRAFRHFAALVEQYHFVEALFLRFRHGPNIREPGDAFYPCQWRGGVTAMRAEPEADRFAIFGEGRGIDDEIDLRLRLVATPETDLIVDQINSCAAFGDIVGANDVVQVHADFGGGV